jgi:hypothetical protein
MHQKENHFFRGPTISISELTNVKSNIHEEPVSLSGNRFRSD